jgi:hypothetical protein
MLDNERGKSVQVQAARLALAAALAFADLLGLAVFALAALLRFATSGRDSGVSRGDETDRSHAAAALLVFDCSGHNEPFSLEAMIAASLSKQLPIGSSAHLPRHTR